MNSSILNNASKIINEYSPGVYYFKEKRSDFDFDIVRFLKSSVELKNLKTTRFCLHEDINADLHEMIIVQTNLLDPVIHKHEKKDESIMLLEGRAELSLYQSDGEIAFKTILSPGEFVVGGNYFRIARNSYHQVKPLSKMIVFKETTTGPFKNDDFIRL